MDLSEQKSLLGADHTDMLGPGDLTCSWMASETNRLRSQHLSEIKGGNMLMLLYCCSCYWESYDCDQEATSQAP